MVGDVGVHGAITGASGVANSRLGVRLASARVAYVIAPHVAYVFNQFHAAVGPVTKPDGAVPNVCKKRATAPETNGAAIDVPDCVAYVFVTPDRNGYADLMDEPGENISTHNP